MADFRGSRQGKAYGMRIESLLNAGGLRVESVGKARSGLGELEEVGFGHAS